MASNRDAASDDTVLCVGLTVIVLICGFAALALMG
jgi:hypothetical protein